MSGATWAEAKNALIALGEARSHAGTRRVHEDALKRLELLADTLYVESLPKDVGSIRKVILVAADLIAASDQPVGLDLYARDAEGKALLWWHPNIVTHSVYTFLCKAEHSLGLGENLPRERSFPGGEAFAAHHRDMLTDRGPAFWAYHLLWFYVFGGDDMRWRMDLPYLWVAERMRGFGRNAPIATMLAQVLRKR